MPSSHALIYHLYCYLSPDLRHQQLTKDNTILWTKMFLMSSFFPNRCQRQLSHYCRFWNHLQSADRRILFPTHRLCSGQGRRSHQQATVQLHLRQHRQPPAAWCLNGRHSPVADAQIQCQRRSPCRRLGVWWKERSPGQLATSTQSCNWHNARTSRHA